MSETVSFSLGRIVATPGALAALEGAGQLPVEFLQRHARGDWGELCDEDRRANACALKTGARLMSSYTLSGEIRLWIITDAVIDEATGERQATTLLLPEEY